MSMKTRFSIIIAATLILGGSLVAFGVTVLEVQPLVTGKAVNLRYSLKNGYGIQKKADNHLIVYQLRSGHEAEKSVRLKIKKYGTEIGRLESFRGRTAKQDTDYYDTLQPGTISLAQKPSGSLALSGRIYYCSFADKFCSVQSITRLISQ